MFKDAKVNLLTAGFSGHKLIMAAHSLGTVMGQGYTKANPDQFLGQVLMGGGVLRSNRANQNSTGKTEF